MLSVIYSSKHENKGQGLVEYAILLVLITVAVIVVISLLGTRIGNTFSTVNNSLETGTSSWTYVATENGVVNVPSGTHQIQYGANGVYTTRTFTGPTTVDCDNATFGDPLVGTVKHCNIQ